MTLKTLGGREAGRLGRARRTGLPLSPTPHPPPAARVSQNMEEIRAEQERMKAQGEKLGGGGAGGVWGVGSAKAGRHHEAGGSGNPNPDTSPPPSDSELSRNLDGLRLDLSNLKSLSEPWEGLGGCGGRRGALPVRL